MKKERRVTADGPGGTRRHDDPPSWLNKALPLKERRRLLDRAIKELTPGSHGGLPEQNKK